MTTPNSCSRCNAGMPSHRVNNLCEECYAEEWDGDYDDECDEEYEEVCPDCGGARIVPDNGTNMGECETCNGTGVME